MLKRKSQSWLGSFRERSSPGLHQRDWCSLWVRVYLPVILIIRWVWGSWRWILRTYPPRGSTSSEEWGTPCRWVQRSNTRGVGGAPAIGETMVLSSLNRARQLQPHPALPVPTLFHRVWKAAQECEKTAPNSQECEKQPPKGRIRVLTPTAVNDRWFGNRLFGDVANSLEKSFGFSVFL